MGLTRSSSSSSASPPQIDCPVFISSSGGDSRFGFHSHLVKALRKRGIGVKSDGQDDLREIPPVLQTAIENSRISIIILSFDYLFSAWSLQVLAKIIECKNRETSKQIVKPVFLMIDREGVKNFCTDGGFGELYEWFKEYPEQVYRWHEAVEEVADLPGWCARYESEAELVEEITRDVVLELKSMLSNDDGICFIPNGRFGRTINSWQRVKHLGSGWFGTVYECMTENGAFIAVKEVSLMDESTRGKESILQLEREISFLSQLEHENIVQYFGAKNDENKLYIFLELVTKGSLANLYQKGPLSDSQVSAYTRQIVNGLKYLHDQNVLHRDIKCANILVEASGSVKLADFGLAKLIKTNDVNSFKGTAFWMAPEVVNPKNHVRVLAADIWSLGCTVLEMLTRQHPYPDLEDVQALFKICQGKPPPVPNTLSSDARDFILKCIQVNPDDRPTAAELLDHPFIKEHCE